MFPNRSTENTIMVYDWFDAFDFQSTMHLQSFFKDLRSSHLKLDFLFVMNEPRGQRLLQSLFSFKKLDGLVLHEMEYKNSRTTWRIVSIQRPKVYLSGQFKSLVSHIPIAKRQKSILYLKALYGALPIVCSPKSQKESLEKT